MPDYGGLCLVKKDGTKSEMLLFRRRVTLGRADYCDLRINLPSVLLEHAEILLEKNQSLVRSMSKTADIKVDEIMVAEALLTQGATIGIGGRSFIYYHANFESAWFDDADSGGKLKTIGGWGRDAPGKAAGGSSKLSKASLPPGVDKDGARLVHDCQHSIYTVAEARKTLALVGGGQAPKNARAKCGMCGYPEASLHCKQ
jgi:hypothetical protein